MIELLKENRPELIKQIVQLENEAFGADGLTEWVLVPLVRHGRVYCLTIGNRLVGAAQYLRDWDNPELAYLVGIAVAKSHQGQGWGTELMKESMRSMSRDGIRELELTVAPDNRGAVEVYKRKLGFVEAGYRRNEYGEGRDRLVMRYKND
ncbi:MAG: GNAT family N-acetyltransferase [Firmicutes bacterium]|nr:GNAT family N-acetyltransferase [Bacillota bacterium]